MSESSPASPIRVGFIGLSPSGWASKIIVPALRAPVNSKLYRIVAVAGRTLETAQAAATKYSEIVGHDVKAFGGQDCASQMANDPDVDFVVVSVKTPNHLEVVMPVIDAGKPFFLEWPIGGNDADNIAGAAEAKGMKNMIGLHYKQILTLKKVKEIIDSGRIGTVLNTNLKVFRAREDGCWGPEVNVTAEHASDPKNGTTMRNVLGGHILPEITLLFGDFTSISATTAIQFPTYTVIGPDGERSEPRTNTDPDHIVFTATTSKGVVSTVSWIVGYPKKATKMIEWEIDGTEGTIRMESSVFGFPHVTEPEVFVDGEKVDLETSYPGEGTGALGNMTRMWTAFAQGDESGYSTLKDGLKVYHVLDSITKSAAEGRRVELSTS